MFGTFAANSCFFVKTDTFVVYTHLQHFGLIFKVWGLVETTEKRASKNDHFFEVHIFLLNVTKNASLGTPQDTIKQQKKHVKTI